MAYCRHELVLAGAEGKLPTDQKCIKCQKIFRVVRAGRK